MLNPSKLLPATWASAFVVLVFVSILLWKRRRNPSSLPPGPSEVDLTGGRVSGNDVIEIFKDCRKNYGPVFSLKRSHGPPMVIITDYEASMSILEKNGIYTGDRPPSIAVGEIAGRGMMSSQMRAGSRHTKFRKGLSAALRPSMAMKYGNIQERHATELVWSIATNPAKFLTHIEKYATDVAFSIAYGQPALDFAPESTTPNGASREKIIAHTQLQGSKLVRWMNPNLYIVNFLPFLARLPSWLYWPRRELDSWFRESTALYAGLMAAVQRARKSDLDGEPLEDVEQSFATYVMDHQTQLGLTDQQAAWLTGNLYAPASETTASAISWAIMAAACYPEAQQAVQKQLDEVVGQNRAPTSRDEANLSTVVAFYLESSRWRQVTPGGLPHCCTKDLEWEGYVIPKGTMIFSSHWLVGRDESLFPNPEEFDIQRWLRPASGSSSKMTVRDDIRNWTYGYGRRVCPGFHVANRSLFVTLAMTLWAFKVVKDEAHPINTLAATPGVAVRPMPFQVKFEPRFELDHLKRVLEMRSALDLGE